MRNIRLEGNEKAVYFAGNSSEVLIKDIIPSEAVRLIDQDEVEIIRNTDIQKRTIEQDSADRIERTKNKKRNGKCGV